MLRCVACSNEQISTIIETQAKEVFAMLNENIKSIRKSKGLSQEELAVKLHVVRQTISKWEQGLSVPDSEMLVSISEVLETSVSTLLGETVMEAKADDLKIISEKLEVINLQLSQRKTSRRKRWHGLFLSLSIGIVIVYACFLAFNSSYLGWDFSNPETAIVGTVAHGFEWLFVRLAPILLIGCVAGAVFTRKKE